MTDEHRYPSVDRQVQVLAQGFALLSASDRDLVMALVARLQAADEPEAFPKDVPFMDFDE